MPELTPTNRALLYGLTADSTFHREAIAAGKAAVTTKENPTGANACAATRSQYFIHLGLLDHVIINAQVLADHLEATCCDRHPVSDMQPGDTVVCADDNTTPGSDHITGCLSVDHAAGTFMAVDNEHAAPYKRNIGHGGYTPAAYVLRLRD